MESDSTDSDQLEEDTQLAIALSISEKIPSNESGYGSNSDKSTLLEKSLGKPQKYHTKELQKHSIQNTSNFETPVLRQNSRNRKKLKIENNESSKHGHNKEFAISQLDNQISSELSETPIPLRRSARLSNLKKSKKSSSPEVLEDYFDTDFSNKSSSETSSSDESTDSKQFKNRALKKPKTDNKNHKQKGSDSTYKKNLAIERDEKKQEIRKYIWDALKDPTQQFKNDESIITLDRLKYCLESCNMDVDDQEIERMISFCNPSNNQYVDNETFNNIFDFIGIKIDDHGRIL